MSRYSIIWKLDLFSYLFQFYLSQQKNNSDEYVKNIEFKCNYILLLINLNIKKDCYLVYNINKIKFKDIFWLWHIFIQNDLMNSVIGFMIIII